MFFLLTAELIPMFIFSTDLIKKSLKLRIFPWPTLLPAIVKWVLFKLKLKPWIFFVELWKFSFFNRTLKKLSAKNKMFLMLKHFLHLNSPSSSSTSFFFADVLYFNDVAPHNDKDVFFYHNLLQFEFSHADAFANDDVEWLPDEAYE